MAGDWIKMRHALVDDPDVIAISATLELDTDCVLGKLFRLWCWADRQLRDGNAVGVTEKWIDCYAGVSGFTTALTNVGWMASNGDGIEFVNFERHMSQSAKTRALTLRRVQKSRGKKCNADGVTKVLPEKRREEKSKTKGKSTKRKVFVPPTVEEVAAYCNERKNNVDAEQFVAFYTSKGWKVGKNPMVIWKSAVVTWEKNLFDNNGSSGDPPPKTSFRPEEFRDHPDHPCNRTDQ